MSILDHRILIPKSSAVVWQHISDISKNPTWQTDCGSVSFIIPSRRTGVGVRWRYSSPDGSEYVAETTAWYEGLGYEYTLVDGVPYQYSKGRVRLQEIPEGTIVQWTFEYEIKGFLGNMRDALTVRRQIDEVMVGSLKKLWRVMNQVGSGEALTESKTLMRDAPDYEQRARYKPRHPSAKVDGNAPPAPVIPEPPVADEDTRPSVAAREVAEPGFLSDLPSQAEPLSTASTTGTEAPSAKVATAEDSAAEAPEPIPADLRRFERPPFVIEPVPIDAQADEAASSPGERQETVRADEADSLKAQAPQTPFEVSATGAMPAVVTLSDSPKKLADMDTAEISVFELFGIPRPSETQQVQAVQPPETPEVGRPSESKPTRVGLRLTLRRQQVNLRRPS